MSSQDDLRNEAAEFYASAGNDFQTDTELSWTFLFDGATVANLEPKSDALRQMGFPEVEIVAPEDIPEDIDLDDLDNIAMSLWAQERTAHTQESFVARVLECQAFADSNGLKMVDFTVGVGQ